VPEIAELALGSAWGLELVFGSEQALENAQQVDFGIEPRWNIVELRWAGNIAAVLDIVVVAAAMDLQLSDIDFAAVAEVGAVIAAAVELDTEPAVAAVVC
jgi:hypothetical protein